MLNDNLYIYYLSSLNMSNGTYLSSTFTYLNLGCHMLFVLKNRLKAQGIPEDKSLKIINDLVTAIFKDHFIKTLLIPQQPINLNILKDIFRKLAHSSIMKLDASSMEKLLYLIIMTVKKEIFNTSSPLELYSLTIGNLKMLQHHCKGANSQSLVQNTIQIFSSTTGSYSFVQYLQIKDYLLTQFETYQTRVINFHEAGQQNNEGKLTYSQRNTHNRMALGSTRNHPAVKIVDGLDKTQNLPLKQWRKWKTSLVLDHPSEYERQSMQRHSRSQNNATNKQKSLNELFGLQKEKMNEFQVRLQLFDYGVESGTASTGKNTAKEGKQQVQSKQQSISKNLKGKIQKEFAALTIAKQEEVDLLDLMDN